MRPENERLLAERFPAILAFLRAAPAPREVVRVEGASFPTLRVDGIQLASAHDPRGEAELQARTVPRDAERAWVYGFAAGHLPRALLAPERGLRALGVVVLDPAAAAASLEQADHTDWLSDPRVELIEGSAPSELAAPFAAAPAALALADASCARLRDLVRLELATPHLRRHLAAREPARAAALEANRSLVAGDGDVAELFGTRAGRSVLVAAAGPTLADHFERLVRRDGLLIAVDAALVPLVRAGVVPDVVVSIDGDERGQPLLFDCDTGRLGECVLVYEPVVPHGVLAAWPGPRRVAYGHHARYEDLRREHPRGSLWSSGSVLHNAVDLAVRTGAARVELLGADFATPRGQTHVPGFAMEHLRTLRSADGAWVLSGRGERVPSYPNLIGYLRDLERYLAAHPRVRFVNAGRDGARIEGTVYPEEERGPVAV